MSRRPEHLGKRKDFSPKVKRQARERANHTCQYPGCDEPAHEVDHILPQGLGGESSLQNAQVLCGACHKRKSAQDTKIMAKADRQGGRSGQFARRSRAKSQNKYRSIASRGFEKSEKMKFDWKRGRYVRV